MKLAATAALVALTVPAAAFAQDQQQLPEPAATVVADCRDNGILDTAYTRQDLDQAEAQVYRSGDTAASTECGPMIDEALQRSLGDAVVPLRDAYLNGRLQGIYTVAQLQDALPVIPQLWDEFTDARALIQTEIDRQNGSATASAAAHRTAPRWARRALVARVRRSLHRHGRLVATVRRSGRVWYGQVRWGTMRRGGCYAEAITKRAVRGHKAGTHTRLYGHTRTALC